MEQEVTFKLGTGPEPLACPVRGCGDRAGRIRGVETRRDLGGVDEAITVAFACGSGHAWSISVDERAGELVYEANGRDLAR
jgi:hypothetical protein